MFAVCSAVIAAGGLATAGGIVASVIRNLAGALLWGIRHGGLELLAYGVVGRLFYPGWEAGTIPERFLRRSYWIGIGLLGASAVVETLVGAPEYPR